ncbi:MAG: FHA domain-containing protein [Planctomycetes bacterium]|nr:FHA domain-containing protein [Planctomycetota bacterium]
MKLILKVKDRVLENYSFQKPDVIVGRDTTADIAIDNPVVSRHHCRLRSNAGEVTLEDLGSANGTYVNGVSVTGPTKLRDGDRIEIGKFVIAIHLPKQVEDFHLKMEGTMQFDGAEIQRRLREHAVPAPSAPAAASVPAHTSPVQPAPARHGSGAQEAAHSHAYAPSPPPPSTPPGALLAVGATLGFVAGFISAAIVFRR